MVKMSSTTESTHTPPTEPSVTFPVKITEEPVATEPVATEPKVATEPVATEPKVAVLPHSIPNIPSSTDDCANIITNSAEYSTTLKSKIIENIKAMDDIRHKVEETRAFATNKSSIPADEVAKSTPGNLMVFTDVVSTVRDRITTAHQKDFKQHADVIRNDIVSFLSLIPKNDISDKLNAILTAE